METTRNPDLSAIKQTPQPAWALGGWGGVPSFFERGSSLVESRAVHERMPKRFVRGIANFAHPVVVVDELGNELVEVCLLSFESSRVELIKSNFCGGWCVRDAYFELLKSVFVSGSGELFVEMRLPLLYSCCRVRHRGDQPAVAVSHRETLRSDVCEFDGGAGWNEHRPPDQRFQAVAFENHDIGHAQHAQRK